MSSTAGRYIARSPRYILSPLDSRMMRFAPMDTRGVTWPAEILDLSESGLAFTLKTDEYPREGESVKIEFTIPGRRQVACFATVTRLEIHDGIKKIAIRFDNLPPIFRAALRFSLKHRVRNSNFDDAEIQLNQGLQPSLMAILQFALASAALVVLFHLMAISPMDFLNLVSHL